MAAASAAWDALADDLYLAAAAYGSAIADLTSSWLGPSSLSMAAAAATYVSWISATAVQAEQTAAQAKAAVAAYEAAFMMTVPPAEIAANRALLLALVATNFFGQNTPAIMATEAHYLEMWAQDAAAMYGYAGASSAASTLTPFTAPTRPPPAHPGSRAGPLRSPRLPHLGRDRRTDGVTAEHRDDAQCAAGACVSDDNVVLEFDLAAVVADLLDVVVEHGTGVCSGPDHGRYLFRVDADFGCRDAGLFGVGDEVAWIGGQHLRPADSRCSNRP